jgi:nitrogen-specific signal transduction histidine kinase
MGDAREQDARKKYSPAQLAAAGAVALELRHEISNPLAALMAEAQLLALEPLAPEHQAAVERMVDLCRRTVALLRQMDVATRSAVNT